MWSAFDSTSLINPGNSLNNFTYNSSALPKIQTFYAVGRVEPPEGEFLIAPGSNDIFVNSAQGRTIGPADPPTPFHALTFLDTITSYINESRTLGWIANDQTKDKYTRLIDSARSNLAANNRGVSKAKLDSVLVNVYPDSAAGLITSEAYALLRFNTEYLLKKLREEDSTFALDNKSSSSDATATNSARHLAKTENYIHEVFASGGEIVYRRSADAGSSWDQTHLINNAFGENSLPCLATTQGGTVQVVWQRKIAPSVFEVWHASSQTNGESWSTPAILPGAGAVQVSQYQIEGAMPVVVERGGRRLVAAYCSTDGLRFRISDDEGQSWQVPAPDIIGGQYAGRVRYPSLASDGTRAWLAYDYANDAGGPYARTFDGTTWSNEVAIATSTDTDNGGAASLAVDDDGYPVASWSGVSSNMQWGRVVVVCMGYPDNKWSKWFSMFGQNVYDWLHPSVTYYRDQERQYRIAAVNHTAENQIKLIHLQSLDPPVWSISTLSTTGAWAGLTQDNALSGNPVHCWTDQSQSPYEVVVGSSQGLLPTAPAALRHSRLAVLRWNNAMLALEVEPLKVVLATGDTTILPFKPAPRRRQDDISLSSMWDYLGSESVSLPASARRLVVSKRFSTRGPLPGRHQFALQLLDPRGTFFAVLDSTGRSGTVSVNLAPYAGRSVVIRPYLTLSALAAGSVNFGVGDVYIEEGNTPLRPTGTKRK